MTDVSRSTNPLITEPTHLDDEAMRPAPSDDIMEALGRVSSPTAKTATTTTRRRGRPPGSKNRTPIQKLADSDPDLAEKLKEQEKREGKKKRAQEIESQIINELNDQLMTFVMGT